MPSQFLAVGHAWCLAWYPRGVSSLQKREEEIITPKDITNRALEGVRELYRGESSADIGDLVKGRQEGLD